MNDAEYVLSSWRELRERSDYSQGGYIGPFDGQAPIVGDLGYLVTRAQLEAIGDTPLRHLSKQATWPGSLTLTVAQDFAEGWTEEDGE